MIKEIYHRLDRRFGLGKYRFYKLFLNFFYPVHLAFSSRKTDDKGSGIIVSLTSFPARIRRIHLVIESLLRQTLPPEKIVLYLSREQFGDLSVLPGKLLKLYRKRLVDIELVDGDIRSHKKYYYAFREYADHTIITVDDDMIYPEDLVEVLVGASENKYVSCTVGAHMRVRDDAPAEYSTWERETEAGVPLYRIMPVGCGGVCYPRGCMTESLLLDRESFMQKTPTADDVWLKFNTLSNAVKVVKTKEYGNFVFVDLIIRKNQKLMTQNVNGMQNDKQIKAVFDDRPDLLARIREDS